MKKTAKQRLPKFKANTLRMEDLKHVTGGLMRVACTCGTVSVCHVDGTDDGDGAGGLRLA